MLQGLLGPLVAMLGGDPVSEGAFYALRSLYSAHNHNQEVRRTDAFLGCQGRDNTAFEATLTIWQP